MFLLSVSKSKGQGSRASSASRSPVHENSLAARAPPAIACLQPFPLRGRSFNSPKGNDPTWTAIVDINRPRGSGQPPAIRPSKSSVVLEDGLEWAVPMVPSGASTGAHEAVEIA